MPELRINGVVEESIVDGPGLRFVVFTQGCPHGCPGCHNPETHDLSGGRRIDTETILAQFGQNPLLSGMTFSGGEPFLHAKALAQLAEQVHARGKTVIVYTGYTVEDLYVLAKTQAEVQALLAQADTLVDGPYLEALREFDSGLRGSSNQRILDRQTVKSLCRELATQEAHGPRAC